MPRLTTAAARAAAGYLAEAVTSGCTLAPFPEDMRPRTPAEARRVAALLRESLGFPVVGLRLVPPPNGLSGPPVAGPVFAARLLHGPVALPPLHRPVATAAVVAQLARPLPARERAWTLREVAARIASLHAAIDIGASRYSAGPSDLPAFMADLAGLGVVVLARPAREGWREAVASPVSARAVAADGSFAWLGTIDAGAALRAAAEAARGVGPLPAGAILIAAGLSPPLPDGALTLSISGLGKAAILAGA